ncbi:BON domain-containing protein [Frateuria defendens]|uniref:BON domain-containing protein n=1 Tax=Frateuria defendens TaxID=2219559 RepID=UPI00069F5DF0|nr:BON domain-containing protein [Frateuria defendens]
MNHRYNPSSPRDEFSRRESQQGHQGYGRQQGDDFEAQRWERDYEPGQSPEREPYRGRASASERGYSEYGQDYDSPWGESGAMRGGSYGQRYGGEGGSRGQPGGYGGRQGYGGQHGGYGQGRFSHSQSSHGWYGGQREEPWQGQGGGWQNLGWQDQGGDDLRYVGGRESGGRGGEQRYGGEYQAGRYGGMGGGMGQGQEMGQGMGGGMGRNLRGKGPKGYQRSDERIREDVCERLSDDPEIDASEVEVQVKQGNVTLQGEVPSRYMKHRAEDCADACSGVKDVDNRIHISASATGEAQGATLRGEGPRSGMGATPGGGTGKPS